MSRRQQSIVAFVLTLLLLAIAAQASGEPSEWRNEWPDTDFSQHAVPLHEIRSGGPPRDGIPAIDEPIFVPVDEVSDLAPQEPVIVLEIDGDARAYPLRVLTWHEIVNDEIGGRPVAVTYCPLCNAAIAFDRSVDGRVLDFGTTGKLRHSDLVMYDRQTESWWQQYTGEAIVGEMVGNRLPMLPARVESFERFQERHPDGKVLVPRDPSFRPYGTNPYVAYDRSPQPFLYDGTYPAGIPPMAYVVAVGDKAWPLSLLRERRRIESDGLVLTWEPGQSSALDERIIAEGRDIGNVNVHRWTEDRLEPVLFHVTFAFVFHAFQSEGEIILR
jgi:hypothetical protein